MKLAYFSFFSIALFFAFPVLAQEKIENAGFLPGNIWYSKDPFTAGDRIDIHTIVFNSGGRSFTSTVEFYDGETLLGKREVTVSPNGGYSDVSIPWKVTEGYHKIYAVIKNTAVTNNRTDESEKFVAAPTSAGNATSSAKTFVTEKLDVAKEYAEKNLPAPVLDTAQAGAGALEWLREESKAWADGKAADFNTKIAVLASAPSKDAVTDAGKFLGGAERPLAYIGAFAMSLAAMALDSKLLFYGGLFAILFFGIRFVKRTFFF